MPPRRRRGPAMCTSVTPPPAVNRRYLRARAAAAAAALLLLCCGGCGGDETAGGAADLPGPVPEGTAFRDPPPDALPAPPFTAELLDGTPLRAADLWRDRPVVLVFTASWCESCADVHEAVAR